MFKANFTLVGTAPYSASKYVNVPKLEKEHPDAYEQRTWRYRMHTTQSGEVCIPGIAVQKCIGEAAKFLSRKIPGKGNATWTKHFEAGLMVTDAELPLGMQASDVPGVQVFVPSDGVSGGGKRVMKTFPTVPMGWKTKVEVLIIDDTITQEEFKYTLQQAGLLIGLGSYRPRNKGMNGRFVVENLTFTQV